MRLHRWLASTLAVGLLACAAGLVSVAGSQAAPQLPQACIDAGITNPKECNALLKKGGAKGHDTPPGDSAGAPAKGGDNPSGNPPAAAATNSPDTNASGSPNGGDQKVVSD